MVFTTQPQHSATGDEDLEIGGRLQQIGVDALYQGATNPFPWMSEMIDLKKEKNFFETRVTEYQTGGTLSWD